LFYFDFLLNSSLAARRVDGQWLTFPFPFVHHQPLNFSLWKQELKENKNANRGNQNSKEDKTLNKMRIQTGQDYEWFSRRLPAWS